MSSQFRSPLSGCKRLRISSLIDMPADDDDLFGLGGSADACLEEMRKRGMSDTIFLQHWFKWQWKKKMWKRSKGLLCPCETKFKPTTPA